MIGIVGYGIVGKTTHQTLFPDNEVIIHDSSHNTNLKDVFSCNLIIICVPTSNKKEVDIIKSICLEINQNNTEVEIVIRSTLPPGFFNELQTQINNPLTYLPEFLRERYASEDSLNCKRLFYSTNASPSQLITFDKFNFKLRKINFSELELLKMMRNNYHAMKIVFANHYYDLCKKYNVDYNSLLNSFNKSKNGQTYLDVNENLRGYGGKCLPKDIDFMIEEFGDEVELFKSIKKDNLKWPITIRGDK
jgi:UDPglucose 6-dehydrogenase